MKQLLKKLKSCVTSVSGRVAIALLAVATFVTAPVYAGGEVVLPDMPIDWQAYSNAAMVIVGAVIGSVIGMVIIIALCRAGVRFVSAAVQGRNI